ncbi:MAG: hypothetical protein HOF34_10435, partial [Rhodospirillaceae bacterium]|nr:hypothetical protein [Rhodospirillaceae bacterium]
IYCSAFPYWKRNLTWLFRHAAGLIEPEAGTVIPESERPRIIFETHLSRYTAEHSFEPVLRRLFAAGYEVSLAASSWERGTEVVETFGYKGVEKIRSDGVIRTLFESISADDAVKLICETGGLRTVILSPSA